MNALSRHLMVTGDNVTGLTDQLVAEGWVKLIPDRHDRRSLIVKFTAAGRKQSLLMVEADEAWLVEMLDGFDAGQRDALYEILVRFRVHLAEKETDTLGERAGNPGGPSKPRRNNGKENP